MNDEERRQTERNIRSNDLLTENSGDFTGIPMVVTLMQELTTRTANVRQAFENQLAGDSDVRQDYDVVRETYRSLLVDMREIAALARSIGRRVVGFEELFRVPPGSGKRKLIAEAAVFADNAQTHRQQFLDYGMDAGFITDLQAKAAALETALNEAAASTGERVGATDTLGADVSAASDAVEMLDPIVKMVYRSDRAKLAAWVFASHIERHTPKPRTTPTS